MYVAHSFPNRHIIVNIVSHILYKRRLLHDLPMNHFSPVNSGGWSLEDVKATA